MSKDNEGRQSETATEELLVRQGRIAQYRDWLVPATIFSSIAVTVFILAITTSKPGYLTVAIAITSFVAVGLYIISLFYAFTRLESITVFQYEAIDEPGLLFRSAIFGTLFLVVSLVCLSFEKSVIIGGSITVSFVLLLIGIILMVRYESHLPR
jgi:hypothetical protein